MVVIAMFVPPTRSSIIRVRILDDHNLMGLAMAQSKVVYTHIGIFDWPDRDRKLCPSFHIAPTHPNLDPETAINSPRHTIHGLCNPATTNSL